MKTHNRFVAEVPALHQQQNIRWLVLEGDVEQTGGWYVYAHQSLEEGADFDSWHPTRSEAEREAVNRWGVTAAGWKPSD